MGKCYLITGSSGYLGNHLVKVLCQNNVDEVSNVKLMDKMIGDDVREEQQKLCDEAGIVGEWIVGDITNKESVKNVLKDIDVVIHTAAIVDIHDYVREDEMRNVILQGTVNILESCCLANVPHFIYTSSSAVVGPNTNADPFLMGDEDTPYLIKHGTFYTKYKHEAEQQVLAANGRKMANGKAFLTCALRPSGIYGGDNIYMKQVLLSAHKSKTLYSLSSKTVLCNFSFVDNVAWSHILAAKKIQTKGLLVGGNAYFLGDDTLQMSYMRLMLVLVEPFGYTISREPILPFWVVYILAFLVVTISKLIAFFNIHKKPFLTPAVLVLFTTTFTFSHKKFKKNFEYKPLVGWEESKERTREDLQKMMKECAG